MECKILNLVTWPWLRPIQGRLVVRRLTLEITYNDTKFDDSSFSHHALRGSDCEIWPPTESKPLNRLRKNVTVDYVCKTNCYTNFGANPSTGGFWANGWNVTLNYFYIFGEQPTGQTVRPILTRDDSKDAKSREDVPSGVTKIKDDI